MTREELIKAWVCYRGEANVTNDQLQAIKWAWEYLRGSCCQRGKDSQVEIKKIDWEQRRYEIAKEMLPCVTTLRYNASEDVGINPVACAGDAVIFADMLIEELKSRECKQTTNKTINHYDN